MEQRLENLNCAKIEVDCGPHRTLEDPGFRRADGTRVHFRNIVPELLSLIDEADYVVGCVAWLTHPDILTALAAKRGVSLVVQKEDWLRPDSGGGWSRERVRMQYSMLPDMCRYDHGLRGAAVHMMSCAGDPTLHAVRCVGNHNSDRRPASPRMHHKFIVCGRATVHAEEMPTIPHIARLDQPYESTTAIMDSFEPFAVWTGSFNFTANGENSLENAIEIRDPDVVRAYFREYGQIAAISEPLDWESEWVAPEWRDGT